MLFMWCSRSRRARTVSCFACSTGAGVVRNSECVTSVFHALTVSDDTTIELMSQLQFQARQPPIQCQTLLERKHYE